MVNAVAVAVLALLLAVPVHAAGGASAAELAKAEELVRNGRAGEAYALLQQHEAQSAGEPDFDYWLGVAALESGRPDKASIALERALIVQPDFVGARLDLARAYFALGDYERARIEFRTVLDQSPPQEARVTIERYLADMDTRATLRRPRFTGYLDGTIGYDTNVNNSPASSSVFVPLFGLDLALAPSSIKSSAWFLGVGGGGELTVPLTVEIGAYAGLDARRRSHSRAEDFDYDRFDGRVGLQYGTERDIVRAGLNHGRFYLDHRYNYETTGAGAEWRHAFDPRHVGNLVAQYNEIRFPDPTLQGNDVNQTVLGGGWTYALDPQRGIVLSGGLFWAHENDIRNRVDGARKLLGVRFVAQHGVGTQWESYAAVGTQVSDYDLENFVFETTRKDRLYEIALGAIWHPSREWSVRPQIAYTRTKSNIAIYDYDRYDVSVTLRRDFR